MDGNVWNDLWRWQYWLILLANWALVPFAWLTYRGGAPVWGAYLLIQVGTIWLNDKVSGSRWTLALLCVNLIAATGVAHWLSNTLYCSWVSADGLSFAIGELGLYAGVALTAVMSVFAVAARGRRRS
jgi:hypothetical protein